jgi:thioredoxin reductase (NADPH)
MRDIIIIGGGAAGLSAALYALGKRLDTAAIYEEVGGKAGAQQHIQGQVGEEYLAGAEAIQLFERRVTAHAGAILHDRVIGLTTSGGTLLVETQRHGTLSARAAILATGATPLRLDIPGAKELLNHGIGYSITTHAQLADGKAVAVIGATRRVLQGVIELARWAAQVYLLVPGDADLSVGVARALRRMPNVDVMSGYTLVEIAGSGTVERLAVEREGERSWLKVDAVFADLGLLPNSGAVRQLAKTDREGFVVVDAKNATTCPGLFAAGDVTTAFGENMLIAIGDGARAAASAYEYLLAHPVAREAEPAD